MGYGAPPLALQLRLILPDLFDAWMVQLAPFEPEPTIVVALSGGADSMALALLLRDWVWARNGRLVAVTVDHAIRDGSADEARQVAGFMAQLGVEHHIIKDECATPPATGVQAWARQLRYRLLEEFCAAHGVLHVAVAHHADDQRETQIMRAKRDGQVLGQAGMSAVRQLAYCRIIRPLLLVPKLDLETFLRGRNQLWVCDPSNESLKYERNALRASEPQEVVQLECREVIEARLAARMTMLCEVRPNGTGYWHAHKMTESKEDMWLLARLLMVVGRSVKPPRGESVRRLVDAMLRQKRATLHRVMITHHDNGWLIEPELRAVPAAVSFAVGAQSEAQHWHGFTWGLADALPQGEYMWGMVDDAVMVQLKLLPDLAHVKPSVLRNNQVLMREGKPVILPFLAWATAGFAHVAPPLFAPPRPAMDAPFVTLRNP